MTDASERPVHGRPREFDFEAALDAALHQFWQRGYAATSLDELTASMGLSRSSFYGAFGSKHAVFLASVQRYADGCFRMFEAIAAGETDPRRAVGQIVEAAAIPEAGTRGCLLVNTLAELAPGDEAVRAVALAQVERVVALITGLLVQAGHEAGAAATVGRTLLSVAFGATVLRKAGCADAAIAALVAQAGLLIDPAYAVAGRA